MVYSCDTSKFANINNYADAVRLVESTTPNRGTDLRPLRRDRKLRDVYNIRFVRSPDKDTLPDVAIRHYDTDVIIYHADETVSIHDYSSRSTTALQNAVVPYGLAVYQRNMYKQVNGWAFAPDRSYMTLTKVGIDQWRPIDNDQIGYPVAPGRKFPDKEVGHTMRKLYEYVRALQAINGGRETTIYAAVSRPKVLALTAQRPDIFGKLAQDVRQHKNDLENLLKLYSSHHGTDQDRAHQISQFLRLAPVPNAKIKKNIYKILTFEGLQELFPNFADSFSFSF